MQRAPQGRRAASATRRRRPRLVGAGAPATRRAARPPSPPMAAGVEATAGGTAVACTSSEAMAGLELGPRRRPRAAAACARNGPGGDQGHGAVEEQLGWLEGMARGAGARATSVRCGRALPALDLASGVLPAMTQSALARSAAAHLSVNWYCTVVEYRIQSPAAGSLSLDSGCSSCSVAREHL